MLRSAEMDGIPEKSAELFTVSRNCAKQKTAKSKSLRERGRRARTWISAWCVSLFSMIGKWKGGEGPQEERAERMNQPCATSM